MANAIHNLVFSSDDEEEDYRIGREYKPRINFVIHNDFYFKEKFRLNREDFENLLELIGQNLKHKTSKNNALSPDQQLFITLHWLGNGCQYHGIADMHGVVKATICRTVWRVVDVIIKNLFQQVIQWPTITDNIAKDFLKIGGFPFVCGIVDGTLINIDAPNEHEEQYVDRHGNHSINTLMICGPDMSFYCVNPQRPGATHDARVLRNTLVCQKFNNGWRPFEDAVILGDSGYGLSDWLIPPIFHNPNSQAEKRFNQHHKKTRRLIECAYGIMKERFPCLNHLRLKPEKAAKIIIACAVMHNIARKDDFYYNPPQFTDTETELRAVQVVPNHKARIQHLLRFFQ